MDTNTEKDKVQETPEETIARLTKENKSLIEANSKLVNDNKSLTSANQELADELKNIPDASGKIKELADALEGSQGALNVLQGKYDALLSSSGEEVERLSLALDAAKRVADAHEPTITVAKQDYIVHGKVFTWKGEEYTVDQLLTNGALQKELVDAGVGFLQKK